MTTDRFRADIDGQPETLSRLVQRYTTGEQAGALREAAALLRAAGGPAVLTGMGASYFALQGVRPRFERGGLPVLVEETSYLHEYAHPAVLAGRPLLVVSQSGRSAEAVDLLANLPSTVPLVLVTNNPETELGERANVVLPLGADPDLSVALKTYTSTLGLLTLLAAEAAGESISEVGRQLLAGDPMTRAVEASWEVADAMTAFARGATYTIALGRGPSVASALGAALLVKETAKIPAEGLSGGQFRHGAVEVVQDGTLAIVFTPRGTTSHLNWQLLDELESYGARLLIVGDPDGLPADNARRMTIAISAPDEFLAPVFEIVPTQVLAHEMALENGVDPGSFVNTTPVITSL
jgi:glucosamine--fructose-6-phosphate aminotransferase (isomerizing)